MDWTVSNDGKPLALDYRTGITKQQQQGVGERKVKTV